MPETAPASDPFGIADLVAAASQAPLVRQIREFASWLGDGRKLTQTGRIGLADARHLVDLLDTGDTIDPRIGGKVFKIKSSEELRGLTLVVEWAKAVRLVRVNGMKLAPVQKNAQLAVKPLDLVIKLLETYPKIGKTLFPRGHYRQSLVGDEFSDVAPEFLTALLRVPGPCPLSVLSDMADVMIDARYVFPHMTEMQQRHLRNTIEVDTRIAMSALDVIGVATLKRNSNEVNEFGSLVWDKATVELTPLGRHAIRRLRGMPGSGDPVLTLRVTLLDVDAPKVWRELLVPAAYTLDQVHNVIQAAMGWTNSHMHEFRIADREYGMSGFLCEAHDFDALDESKYRLGDLVKPGDTFEYRYDFGDSWDHEITATAIGEASADAIYPACVTGEGACPPEDSGGAPGFADLKATLAGPPGAERDELRTWAGENYDPARFDLTATNGRLASP